MNYGYIRVSTQKQNFENQKEAISEKFKIDEWVQESKSGTIDYKKRNLGELIKKLTNKDTLIVTEISRLGRSLVMIFKIISELQEKKVKIIAIKNNFDLNVNHLHLKRWRLWCSLPHTLLFHRMSLLARLL